MKIILIIYIIGIILYWAGIVSIISTMMKNKELTLEAFKNRGESKRSPFSNWLTVITGSIIPIFHYAVAFLYIFKPDFIFEKE